MFAHLDELYAASKDLMDEVCPAFMDHVGAWAEAAESGAAASVTEPASVEAGAGVATSPRRASVGASDSVSGLLLRAISGLTVSSLHESVGIMARALAQVSGAGPLFIIPRSFTCYAHDLLAVQVSAGASLDDSDSLIDCTGFLMAIHSAIVDGMA